jgi:O-antigen ligase
MNPRYMKRTILFAGAAGASGAALFGAAVGWRRPDFLSLGTIGFGLGCLSLLISVLVFLSFLKRPAEPGWFSPLKLDVAFAAAVLAGTISYVALSMNRATVYLPLLLVGGFSLYLLMRLNLARVPDSRRFLVLTVPVGLAAVEAIHGLAQFAAGAPMKGFFYNGNHLAMFIAMAVPPATVLAWRKGTVRCRFVYFAAVLILLAAAALSRCRTAYLALIVVLGAMALVRFRAGRGPADPARKKRLLPAALVLGVLCLAVMAALGLTFKQLSAAGRVLIWKASVPMVLDHPVSGVGSAGFPSEYNLYQGRYLKAGGGTTVERLSASSPVYAFNDYIETLVEMGIPGLVVWGAFWFLCIAAAGAAFIKSGRTPASGGSTGDGKKAGIQSADLALGAAGSVIAYMIIAFFYNARQILPIHLLFCGLLALTAEEAGHRGFIPGIAPGRLRRIGMAYSAVVAVIIAVLMPSLFRESRAEREWGHARNLKRAGNLAGAIAECRNALPGLKKNADFLESLGGLFLESGNDAEAITVLERGIALCPSPYALEKLASAKMRIGDLAGARDAALLSDSILPWRLTSKSLLAAIYGRMGDDRVSARYSRSILQTPMKIGTEEGRTLKREALKAWLAAGEDPENPDPPPFQAARLVPDEYRLDVLEALRLAGPRAPGFIDAIRRAAPEERPGLAFLLANMPDRDLVSMDIGILTENVRLAYKARRTVPLASEVPEDVFLNFVLPYAVANERRDGWRPEFFRQFRDAAVSSVEDFAEVANRDVFISRRLGYLERDNRKFLLSPRQTWERGYVSCGEAAILVIDACRSVGIPARLAIMPKWPRRRVGHFWLEVYDSGRWRELTAFDPAPLGRTWVRELMPKIVPLGPENRFYAVSFRKTPIHIMFGGDVSFIDITGDYIR